MNLKYILMTAVIGSFFSCHKSQGIRTPCDQGCRTDIICTNEWRSIVVNVVDQSGAGIEMDEVLVERASDGKVINRNARTMTPQTGRYLLISDDQMNETSRCGEAFVFKGFKDGKLLARQTYQVAHNCCHIILISGDTKIVVDN